MSHQGQGRNGSSQPYPMPHGQGGNGRSPHEHGLHVTCAYMSFIALLVYDYCLTLRHEIKFVWFGKWTYATFLFLIVRYLPFINVVVFILSEFFEVSVQTCNSVVPLMLLLMVINVVVADIILAIRTWAIWRRNRIVGAILVASVVGTIIALTILTYKYYVISRMYPKDQLDRYGNGCASVRFPMGVTGSWEGDDTGIWASYITLAIFEVVILVLVAISALRTGALDNSSQFSFVIHRDGILFNVHLLFMTAANLIIVSTVPLQVIARVSPFAEGIIYSVITGRVVLKIRELGQGYQVENTEFRTNYELASLT